MAHPFTQLRNVDDDGDNGPYAGRTGRSSMIGRDSVAAHDVGVELGLAGGDDDAAATAANGVGGDARHWGAGNGGLAAEAASRGARIAENLRGIASEDTTEGLIARMDLIAEVIGVGGAVGRQLRAAYPRDLLIRVALEKRNDAPHIWTKEAAQAYGRLLRAHVTGTYEGTPNAAGALGGVHSDGSEHGGFGAISPDAMRALLALSSRRKHLRLFGCVMGCVLAVILVVGLIAGRKFGPYYLSNVLLALLSGLCIFVCSREYPSRRQEVLAHELYYLCGFVALVIGTVASLVFLGTITTRVTALCNRYPDTCDGFSETFLNLVGFATAFFMMVAFVAAYAYGLVLSDRYVQLLRIAQLANDGSLVRAEERTLLTPVVQLVATNLTPSGMCMRRYARRVARHSTGALGRCAAALQDPLRRNGPCCGCMSRTCEAVSEADCGCPTWSRNDRICACICVMVVTIPAVVCWQTDDRVACFFSTMIELILQILTAN